MNQSLTDIAELAEDIGASFLYDNRVDLIKIAESEGIQIIEGNYGNHFLGQLVYFSAKFYIILNKDLLSECESGRVRFTIAHELGHYFIDEHRNKLKNGISLSFKEDLENSERKKVETAANHFAANLLMPQSHFLEQITKLDSCLLGILILKMKYDTSIESTINHFINLDISASLVIKWKSNYAYHYAWPSKKFTEITGITKMNIPIRIDANYVKNKVMSIDDLGLDYIESATPISRWISTVMQHTKNDIVGLEQIIKLGDFGGIALLTF